MGSDYSAVSMATSRVVALAKKDRRLHKAMALLKAKREA